MFYPHRISLILPILTLLALHFIGSPGLEAGERYDFRELGTLNSTYSKAYEVNNLGEVVGFSETAASDEHAVIWSQGGITDLALAAGESSRVFGMNDLGILVGYSYVSTNPWEACLWTLGPRYNVSGKPSSQRVDLGTLGGSYSKAYDVDDAGYQHEAILPRFQGVSVVGWADTTSGERHAFLWFRGEMNDLDTLGGTFSRAYGLNNFGQVIGYSETTAGETHAFLWEDGLMTDLETLGGDYSIAYGVNDFGQVVGDSGTSTGDSHAFLWENGDMYDLGTLGGTTSKAYAVNNLGQIVGYATTGTGERHAFLWESGVMKDLNDLVEPGLNWVLYEANGINDGGGYASGQIAGIAESGSHSHAFILSPVKYSSDILLQKAE